MCVLSVCVCLVCVRDVAPPPLVVMSVSVDGRVVAGQQSGDYACVAGIGAGDHVLDCPAY